MPISYAQEIRRKLIHLSSLWIVAAMFFLPRYPGAFFMLALALGNLLLEYAHFRRWSPWYELYEKFFGRMLRDNPSGKLQFSGGPSVLLAAGLTLLCFPRDVACCAMAIMLLGDAAAALIGRRWGKHKLVNGKSLEGVIAFVVFSLPAVFFFGVVSCWPLQFYLAALVGAIAAAIVELFQKQLRLDDNLLLPLVGAAVTFALRHL